MVMMCGWRGGGGRVAVPMMTVMGIDTCELFSCLLCLVLQRRLQWSSAMLVPAASKPWRSPRYHMGTMYPVNHKVLGLGVLQYRNTSGECVMIRYWSL